LLFSRNKKQFYKKIRETDMRSQGQIPEEKSIKEFWKDIWSEETRHNSEAGWIKN
jgi:hypothetical protein